MVNTFLKYLLIGGAVLTIYFDDFWSSNKNYEIYLTSNFYWRFFTHKKHPVGASIHRRQESFPVKPSLVTI